MADEPKARAPGLASPSDRLPPAITRYPTRGTLLAFDFGTKRIGVAVGDAETRLAHPLTVISGADNRMRFTAIGHLIDEWRPVLLVVGLPSHADGATHPVAVAARRFARRLEGRHGLPVALVDERLSSRDAEASLRSAGVRGTRLKSGVDAVAAQRILESYFAGTPEP